MSTFKGIVKEFPQIRIDYFRHITNEEPALACFLSHVHSDHLEGLESLKAPFVYCSPATREILLRLEKYPHRMNFAKGILECRRQTYKHLNKILKTIPLDTPTVIELRPGYEIQVTLLDANHCVGAVMFLIEGQGKAILYTGDIRSEPWWINQLVRNPIILPYTTQVGTLDCVYLDTTFASKSDTYREFASKAEGLGELIEKVAQYPKDTIFYIEAWTFGYEDLWIALANFLNSQIHLDSYRLRLYKSLATTATGTPVCHGAAQLCGFQLGNHRKEGCLTSDHTVRLHSCEKGTGCPLLKQNQNIVRILPIISRQADGVEIHELGIGGGKGDLDQVHELEIFDAAILRELMRLCASSIKDKDLLLQIMTKLNASGRVKLDVDEEGKLEQDEIKLDEFVQILALLTKDDMAIDPTYKQLVPVTGDAGELPRTITFPYSRHSSYSELCGLLEALKPRDVHPCTVDDKNWTPDHSMRSMFGYLCSANIFAHDAEMLASYDARSQGQQVELLASQAAQETQWTTSSYNYGDLARLQAQEQSSQTALPTSEADKFYTPADSSPPAQLPVTLSRIQSSALAASTNNKSQRKASILSNTPPNIQTRERKIRRWAYLAAEGENANHDWNDFGGLESVKQQKESQEL